MTSEAIRRVNRLHAWTSATIRRMPPEDDAAKEAARLTEAKATKTLLTAVKDEATNTYLTALTNRVDVIEGQRVPAPADIQKTLSDQLNRLMTSKSCGQGERWGAADPIRPLPSTSTPLMSAIVVARGRDGGRRIR